MTDAQTEARAIALRALAQAYDREDAAQRGEPDPWNLDDAGDIGDSDTWISERLACAEVAARAFLDAMSNANGVWQPIATAPKAPEVEGWSSGPMILLASIYGHRAIGYWGRGRGNQRYGWVNPHDHMVMDYWGAFTHWQPLPGIPEDDSDA